MEKTIIQLVEEYPQLREFISNRIKEAQKELINAWKECEEKANKDYTYGDADNLHIALFNDYLKEVGN